MVYVVVNTTTGQAEPIRTEPLGYTNASFKQLVPLIEKRELAAWAVYRVERPKDGFPGDPTALAQKAMDTGTKVYEFKDGRGDWMETRIELAGGESE